jgi:hypothetical protein
MDLSAIVYDMCCSKMSCKMSYAACMLRQKRSRTNRRWGTAGLLIATDECNGCPQGAEVMIMHGIKPFKKKKIVCDCGRMVHARELCKICLNKKYMKKK